MPRKTHARRSIRRGERGYTLLEVLIVLAIIALVATMVGPRLLGQLDRSKVTAAHVQMRSLMSALETMRIDLGRYPSTAEGLAALTEAPAVNLESGGVWQGPYLDAGVPDDPWGRPYVYEAPPDEHTRPRVGSLGADGEIGGDGLNADLFSGESK